jgi:5-methylthioadenosine/S-adenosylhomocysteine deaminase
VDATHISMIPLIDPVTALVRQASRSTVTDVFVAGRRLKRGGQLVDVNLADIRRSAHVAAAAVMERSGVDSRWKPELPALCIPGHTGSTSR